MLTCGSGPSPNLLAVLWVSHLVRVSGCLNMSIPARWDCRTVRPVEMATKVRGDHVHAARKYLHNRGPDDLRTTRYFGTAAWTTS